MITGKAPDLDILTKARDRIINDASDVFVRILDERLLEQTDFGEKPLDLAFDDFFNHFFRLTRL